MSAFRTKVKPPASLSVTYSVISQGVFVAKLGWTPAQSAWPNSYYVVYRDDEEYATSISGLTYRDEGVLEGHSHNYDVATVNVNEIESVVGAHGSVSIPFYPVWETGWSLSIVQNTTDSVASRASDPGGGSLTYSRQGGTAPAGVTVSSNGTITVGTSTPGAYTLTIRASNGSLSSDTTITVTVISIVTAPNPPAALTLNLLGEDGVSMVITPASSGPTPDDYDIRYSPTGSAPFTTVPHAGTALTDEVSGLAQGVYYFEARAGIGTEESAWIPGTPSPISISASVAAPANFVISATPSSVTWSGATLRVPLTGGAARAVQPGDIIEIASGVHGPLTIERVIGTAANRVTIRAPQAGAVATIRRSAPGGNGNVFVIGDSCEHFNLSGATVSPSISAAPDGRKKGIRVMYASGATAQNKDGVASFIKFQGGNPAQGFSRPRNFTISDIEVDGGYPGFANNGIGIALNDHSFKLADFPNQWVENVVIEYCYIHDTEGEGMYLGSNPYMTYRGTGVEAGGPDVPLRYIKVRFNYLENIGNNAISFKSVYGGIPGTTGATHNACNGNTVIRAALTAATYAVAANSSIMAFYDNVVRDCLDKGIAGFISDGTPIDKVISWVAYNNLVHDCADDGFLFQKNSAKQGPPVPGASCQVYCNTSVRNAGAGFTTNAGITGFVKNNIGLGNTGAQFTINASATESSNLAAGALASIFVNPGADNFRLLGAQLASGTIGTDIPSTDLDGRARVQGTADKGCYEF